MSPWGWSPERSQGIWRYGAVWLKPFVAAAPWLTVVLLLVMIHLVGGTFTAAKGVLFDLPAGQLAEGEATGLVALVMPTDHETLVFFDDSRYLLGDDASAATLREHLSESVRHTGDKTLLVLADRRVAGGDLMKLSGIARNGGVEKVLFAEKRQERAE